MKRIGIGLVGFGMIGRVHALAYRELPYYYPGQLPPLELAAVCTGRADSAERAAREGGFGAWMTDITELVARDDVDVVDICLPNDVHRAAALAAIRAGKHVLVDKPLALDAAQAAEILDAARGANVRVGMVFNYRFIPAIARARELVAGGALGEVFHFHLEYLHTGYQDANRPLSWRLSRSRAGGGALMDLGSHLVDLTRYLLGEFEAVSATTRTYVTSRPVRAGSEERAPVDVDDAAWLTASLANGATGTLFATRFATGAVDDLNVQIFGARGALQFRLQDANVLQYFDATLPASQRGWARIPTATEYPGAAVPPPRAILGWNRTHAENIYQFLRALVEDAPFAPDAHDGLRAHHVLDAAYASAATRAPVELS